MKTNKATRKGRILSITVVTRPDECPDTSWLGEYGEDYNPAAIVCETGEFVADIERREKILDRLSDEVSFRECSDTPLDSTIPRQRLEKLTAEWEDLNRIPERGRRYRYFTPCAGGEKPGGKYWRKYARQDYDRMEALSRGDWYFMGIVAEARITLPGSDVIQRITSGGLWGIESDCGDYQREVEDDQLVELRGELEALGFGGRALDVAFNDIESVHN